MNDPREAIAHVMWEKTNGVGWDFASKDDRDYAFEWADAVIEAMDLQPAWGVDLAGTVLSTSGQAEAGAVMSRPTMKRWVTPWVEQPK